MDVALPGSLSLWLGVMVVRHTQHVSTPPGSKDDLETRRGTIAAPVGDSELTSSLLVLQRSSTDVCLEW